MPRLQPEAGLVLSYAFLWQSEHQTGQEEGLKDRPCVIILAVQREADGPLIVTVLPITHRAPTIPGAAVEISAAIKHHLGLDEQRSWVVVTEGNEFLWPGHDLRAIPQTGRYDYGFLPPRFFRQIQEALLAWYRERPGTVTQRT